MRAMVPDGQGSVRLDEVHQPAARADEAVVGVQAYSVNRGETFLLDARQPPWRPGKDVAGRVVRVAGDGSGPAVGTRVVGHAADSGWAERAAVSTAALAVLPDDVSFSVAAALPLAGLTALRMLRAAGSVAGRRLLVTGASGGVGHYLTELAVNAGADVTAVTATPERGRRLREFGATTVSHPKEAAGWFDVGFESVGGESFTEVRRRVRPRGLLIWFGQAGGEPVRLDFFDWVDDTAGAPIMQFDYQGGHDGRHDRRHGADGEDLTTLVRLVDQGRLHPEIGSVRPWRDTAQVIDDLRARRVRGNAVLEVA